MPETETEERTECACCGESECGCTPCDTCSEPTDSRCSNCERCDECCECESCEGCDSRVDSTCSRCQGCSDCCECSHCDRCSEPCESTCSDCDRCESCCECRFCEGCSENVHDRNYCDDCERCRECCHCGESVAEFVDRDIRFFDSETFERNPSRRHISVELEIDCAAEFRQTGAACHVWSVSVVEDGSLGDAGFELNTSPAQGDKFAQIATAICDALKYDGAEVNTDCGYHVHVDARDYTHSDIVNLIRVYDRIEDALFSLVSPSRQNNRYCKRCGPEMTARLDGADNRESVAHAVYKTKDKKILDDAKGAKYNDARYAALNVHSWVYRGTIECRLHHGTTDPRKVINWGILWASIVDYSKSMDASALPADSWQALLTIAPTDDVRQWLTERRAKFNR